MTIRKSTRFIDIKGKKFHGLTVVKYLGVVKHKSMWQCNCVCGKVIKVEKGKLTDKPYGTKSCGCLTNRRNSVGSDYLNRLGTSTKFHNGWQWLPD